MGNTTTTNNKKKKSNARKLIPAIGMLMTSAAMLTTSTYAWFTMNKEVSITGITLTASVPETLEISLGSKADGKLPSQNAGTNVITVQEPSNDDSGSDWSNTVDIATYYRVNSPNNAINFGQLVPVSSTNGVNMFFTSDAVGDGKSIKDTAKFTKETNQLISSGPNRYYLDIPVWFRSTATSAAEANVSLSVKATITNTGAEGDQTVLYKAARVSILNADKSESEGVILPEGASYNQAGKAVVKQGTISTDEDNKKSTYYGDVDSVIQTGQEGADTVVQVPKRVDNGNYDNTNTRHGAMKPMIVRIWLEGEDASCFNPNAGQSFKISLEFKDKAAQTNQSGQSNS